MKRLLLSALALLSPGIALAHAGHGLDDIAHGVLHGEHLVLLAGLIGLVYLVRRLRARNRDD